MGLFRRILDYDTYSYFEPCFFYFLSGKMLYTSKQPLTNILLFSMMVMIAAGTQTGCEHWAMKWQARTSSILHLDGAMEDNSTSKQVSFPKWLNEA